MPLGRSLRILVVDDDPFVGDVVCRLLAHDGHVTTWCDNGERALEVFAAARPEYELLLLDLNMPLMNGADLLDAIADLNGASRIPPTIIMTGLGAKRQTDQLRDENHVTAVLRKPFSMPVLRESIRSAVARVPLRAHS